MRHRVDIQIGERVRELRLEKGMTQTDLALRIGVSFQQMQKYETATNRISVSRLAMIAKAMDTTAEKLVRGIRA